MRIIGVDPGLRALGLADVVITSDGTRVVKLRVVHTEPDDEVKRKADDLSIRMRELARQVNDFLDGGSEIIAFCVEIKALPYKKGKPLFTPTTASSLGRVRGLFDMAAEFLELPVFEFGPQILKRLTAGKADAEKDQVVSAVSRLYPETKNLWPGAQADRQHVADAIAAVHVGLQTPELAALIRRELAGAAAVERYVEQET